MFCSIISASYICPPRCYQHLRAVHLYGRCTLNTSDFTTKDIDRFWSKVNIPDDPDACWEWKAYITPTGYSQFNINGKNIYGHRFSYLVAHGQLPDSLSVLHKCDNRQCVNPTHLFLGTQADNVQDMINKGRYRKAYRPAKGESNGTSKLTLTQVGEIRKRYIKGKFGTVLLGRIYNVTPRNIWLIVNNKAWKEDE